MPNWKHIAAFAVAAPFIALSSLYVFCALLKIPLLFGVLLVAASLIVTSFLFGLLSQRVGLVVKVGSVLWSGIVALISPAALILAVCFAGALLHIRDSCI
jgi:hypothetical protein